MAGTGSRTRLALLSGVAVASVAVAGALNQQASANPVGVANTDVAAACTTTVTTQLSSLVVTSGITCIDGTHGGGVTGPITVTRGAGLYVEDATVGSITASSPQMVWLCGTTSKSVSVSGATGFNALVNTYFSPIGVWIGWGCTGPATNTVNGSVAIANSAASDAVSGTLNGVVNDNNNRSNFAGGTVVAAYGTFNGKVTVAHSAGPVAFIYSFFFQPIAANFNVGAVDIHNNWLYNAGTAAFNTGGVNVQANMLHGTFSSVGNSAPVVISNNTPF